MPMAYTEVTGRYTQDSREIMMDTDINEGAVDNPNNIPGFKQTTNFKPQYASAAQPKKEKRLIAKIFSNLSRLGMDYEEDVVKNMRAVPADKNLLPKPFQYENQDLFTQLSTSWKQKSNADKSFYEKDFAIKRDSLRKLAVQPELEEILDSLADECVVYDSNYTYFAEPYIDTVDLKDFNKETQDKITDTMANSYRKIYKMLSWKTNAWDDFKRFLVEGILSWEIVYDSLEKPTKIIGIIPIDPATITKKYDNGKWYWIQYKGMNGKERKLLDSQIVYVQYQETNCLTRLSYLERLIRPYNIYRIVEQAQIIWTVTNAQYKSVFKIPVKSMNKVLASQTVASAMNRYKEDIKFIGDSGELTFNGQVNMPFNKEYWLPDGDNGTPEIDNLGGDGPELNDSDQLKYFRNQLYKISKIPLNRFDQESGETWFGTDATSATRTEISFGRFVTRLRNIFSQVILKPLQIQLALSIPEIADDKAFLNSIQLQWKSYNLFEELMQIELQDKRVEFIQNMKDSMVDMTDDGSEVKFFASEFLVRKYLKLSDADLNLNNKLKEEETERLKLAGSGSEDEESFESQKDDLINIIKEVIDGKEEEVKEKIKKRKKKPKRKGEEE